MYHDIAAKIYDHNITALLSNYSIIADVIEGIFLAPQMQRSLHKNWPQNVH